MAVINLNVPDAVAHALNKARAATGFETRDQFITNVLVDHGLNPKVQAAYAKVNKAKNAVAAKEAKAASEAAQRAFAEAQNAKVIELEKK